MNGAAFSLTDEIKAVARGFAPGRKGKTARHLEPSLTQELQRVASRKRKPPTTREGRMGVVIYFDQNVADAIRRLKSDYGATNQALGEMAFKYLFEKFGEPWPAEESQPRVR